MRFLGFKSPAGFFATLVYLFLYIPIAVLVIFSFNNAMFPAPWKGFTFKWYVQLFHATHIWDALYSSLIISSISVILSVVLGVSFIFYAAHSPRVQKVLQVFYANLIIPEIVLAIGLVSFFVLFSVPLGYITLIVAHTVLGLGYVIPLLYMQFLELDPRLVEASRDLGATRMQTFWRISLPLLRSSIVASALLVFMISFDDFVLAYFCAGSSVETLPLYILSVLRSGITPVINALSTLLLVFSSLLVVILCSLKIRTRIF